MAEMSVLQTLKAARKLITPRENWTQRQMAATACGSKVGANSPEAICWCADGALTKVSSSYREAYSKACYLLSAACGRPGSVWAFISFNDTHTHAEVLAAFDEAIKRANT